MQTYGEGQQTIQIQYKYNNNKSYLGMTAQLVVEDLLEVMRTTKLCISNFASIKWFGFQNSRLNKIHQIVICNHNQNQQNT